MSSPGGPSRDRRGVPPRLTSRLRATGSGRRSPSGDREGGLPPRLFVRHDHESGNSRRQAGMWRSVVGPTETIVIGQRGHSDRTRRTSSRVTRLKASSSRSTEIYSRRNPVEPE